ncbi:MAG: RNA polymerase-associated protein RapA [Cellvibrionaceae bacterium]|nr:RNA polymerase-associated protein RapA [Cellvibrionaceae bacterium]
MTYTIGQRWASLTETHLGLGVITHIENRRLQISFPASDETRLYAMNNAPLTRINYTVGDTVMNMEEQTFTLTDIHEREGLFYYEATDKDGKAVTLDELDLSCFVQFTSPQQRLFNGQVDSHKQFALRAKTLELLHRCEQSSVQGLMGSRTALLPHQIYIAHEVARRHAPRVLLADEVGLGKTIEAGMIVHHQLLAGQVSRVLILVPDSLVHQWLVEMLRKFNLHFAVFDQERIDASDSDNPFDTEQLILCPLSLLTGHDTIKAQALATHWDMVVVDEAHHLLWHETETSPEYQCVEQLGKIAASLLLLTATPEQVGISGHFARLRLLDPARFHDLAQFTQEQDNYAALNPLLTALKNHSLSDQQQRQLAQYIGQDTLDTEDTDTLIAQLLDRHGTGRVLFRNTRAAIAGFPKRCPHSYPLPYHDAPAHTTEIDAALYPEQLHKTANWLKTDPRVNWLVDTLKQLQPQQLLVICHHADTAIALDNYLNLRAGIRSSCFHEGLSIVERDRAAAYFAEGSYELTDAQGTQTQGAQTLICSEIGSEGRNFQFAHHLVLFDLPLNPDLLEQRIGRLDRIGQQQDIQIHIPYLQHSAQEILYRWYHQGLNLFQRSCSAAYSIYQQQADKLHPHLLQAEPAAEDFIQLVTDTQTLTAHTLEELRRGRDKLLELNSCKTDIATQLIDTIKNKENAEELQQYMETVFEHYHIESEYHSEGCLMIRPSDRSQGHFPGLREEGNTVTFMRDKAVAREDMDFLSWEHPMVTEAMDMIYRSELGNTALATVSIKGLAEGSLLLETWFTLDVIADKKLGLQRYLPLHPSRFLISDKQQNYANALPHDTLSQLCSKIPNKIAQAVIQQTKPTVVNLLAHTEKLAAEQTQKLRDAALETLHQELGAELQRLQALRAVNPSIRQAEIDFIEHRIEACSQHTQRASLRLNAMRIVINHSK